MYPGYPTVVRWRWLSQRLTMVNLTKSGHPWRLRDQAGHASWMPRRGAVNAVRAARRCPGG